MSSTDIILNRANVALARSQRLVASWLPPQPTEEKTSANTKSEELQREEDEIFTAAPETLGVGAPLPTKLPDGSWNRAELDSNDQLRRQLLGRNYRKVMKEKAQAQAQKSSAASASASEKAGGDQNHSSNSAVNNETVYEEDYDEEEGRTAAVGKEFAKSQSQPTKSQKKKNKKRKAGSGPEEPLQSQSETAADASGGGDPEKEKQEGEGQKVDVQEDSSTKQNAGTSGSSSRPAPRGKKKATSFLDEILAERSKKRKKR